MMQKNPFVFLFTLVLVALLAVNVPVVFAQDVGVKSGVESKDLTVKDFVVEAKGKISQITIEEAKARFDSGAVFLDVREPDEFKSGHVPGAINLPRGVLEFEIGKKVADKNKNIVVYCESGDRGALATLILNQMGYKKAVNMDRGIVGWLIEGYPVE